jgi:hypothetical protein
MFKFNIPDPYSKNNVADWAELYMAYSQEELSKSVLSSYIEGSAGEEQSESFVGSVLQELEARENLYGAKPPFHANGRLAQVAINWKDCPEYMACLIFALLGNKVQPTVSGKLFERITGEALRNCLGGDSIIYGHPKTFSLNDVCCRMNEKFNCHPPKKRKDRNLDVIAWKPFGDARASQPIILVQCAAGNNWKSKLKELNLDAWRRYIHFACPPIKGFSVPIIVSDPSEIEEYSLDAGIFIDRIRLYRGSISSIPVDTNLRRELIRWCNRRLTEIS